MMCFLRSCRLWYQQDTTYAGQRIRDAALQCLGMIVIGKPSLMLQQLQLSLLHIGADVEEPLAPKSSGTGSPDNVGSGGLQQPISGTCAAEVLETALSGDSPASVKTRVLTNYIELLRSEEAALKVRQKDAEAASTSSRVPSTNAASDTSIPLAKVNGETDAAISSTSSIIQRVWEHVLRLATAVPIGGVNGVPGTPGAAAACGSTTVEAAAMRRKALELIEMVLREGLVAPWTAIAALVAQLTDEAPETRALALKVLKEAASKYTEFVAKELAPGVLEAFSFQSRLWGTKHPGQPLPKSPSAEVLEGLAAMYSDVIGTLPPNKQPNIRQRFLANLLKPFEAACNLANPSAAAREDVHKLAFCAYVAASLAFRHADEPLVLIHAINSTVSRHAQEVKLSLKRQLLVTGLRRLLQLDGDDEDTDYDIVSRRQQPALTAQQSDEHQPQQQQQPAQQQPVKQEKYDIKQERLQVDQQQHYHKQLIVLLSLPLQQELLAPLKASLALSMLLVLKQYLMAAYSLSDERIAAFELKGPKYQSEVKALVSKDKRVGDFSLSVINLRAIDDATGELLCGQYKTYKGLLDNDAANYK
eukprot:GHRR01023045.1.p1 GENE.GHRR01023045.1~~GHRR01023045.1.p1  ORF type:complete len:588 (+),score=234.95 GHRR01023045.1:158-1921(+)